jgi:two-component system sensor histidine kinase DctS
MTGFSPEELVGATPPMPYWAPEQLEESYAMHQTVLAGEAPDDGFEMTFMRKNGERFHALVYEAKLIDGNGKHTGWMASVLDITERKRAEELARQQQEQLQFTSRLVTMGEMASTLAHELNQPLAAIASYNTGCLNLMANGQAGVDDIRPALEKMGPGPARRQDHPPGARLRAQERAETGPLPTRRSHRGLPRLHRAGSPQAPCPHRMRHTATAAGPGRPPDAGTGAPQPDAQRHGSHGQHAAGPAAAPRRPGQPEELRISVSDNGSGIAPEIRDKLFIAFFTTKPEGMGVGLSICRSIIEFHRGRLWAEDNPIRRPEAVRYFTSPFPWTA